MTINNNLVFSGIYRGKVLATDALETDKVGRIKVEIYPMLIGRTTALELKKNDPLLDVEGIDTADLPWAVPAMPIFEGAGSGYGCFAIPSVNSFVFVFFEGGDINQPVYFAEAQTKTMGVPASALTNYPNRKVVRTSSGIEVIIDKTSGLVSVSGATTVNITSSSQVNITSPTINVTGASEINITGDADINVEGGEVNVTGNPINLN